MDPSTELVVVAILLLRDELRYWRLHREANAVRQSVEGSTVVVRGGDDPPDALRGLLRRRGTDANGTEEAPE